MLTPTMPSPLPIRMRVAARLVTAEQQLQSAWDIRKLMDEREDHLIPGIERVIARLTLYVHRLEKTLAKLKR